MTVLTSVAGTHDPASFFVVFGIFVLLSVVLVFFVVRFALKLSRERAAGAGRRPRRSP
jgi:hypothetical protein